MKKLFVSFLALSLTLPLLAEGENDKGKIPGSGLVPPVSVPIKPKPQPKINRPNSPFEQYIDCLYDGENLVFNFTIPEGECSLTVSQIDKGAISFYRFDSSEEAVVYVGEIWNATITVDTALGNSYEGYLGE